MTGASLLVQVFCFRRESGKTLCLGQHVCEHVGVGKIPGSEGEMQGSAGKGGEIKGHARTCRGQEVDMTGSKGT